MMQVLVSFCCQPYYFVATNARDPSNALGYATTNANLEPGDEPTLRNSN